MKKLIVGDVTEYLAVYALKQNKSAKLVTPDSINEYLQSANGTFYTSIGDFDSPADFCSVLMSADEITYYPPAVWSDIDIIKDVRFSAETETKEHLYQWSYIRKQPVINLDVPDYLDIEFGDSIKINPRISESRQIWNFGCSITAGVGVDADKTYGSLIGRELDLPVMNLAYEGSSIKWSSDQILLSDIKKDDIVIWGVTSRYRYSYFLHKQRWYHILPAFLDLYPLAKNLLPRDWLISPHVAHEHLQSILIANNFCKKIGAHLIMMGVFNQTYYDNSLAQYPNFISNTRKFKDLGTDGCHPGPEQHKLYAKTLKDYIDKQGWLSIDQ